MSAKALGGASAVGLAAGFFSGLFGLGGGILIVPGLLLFFRMSQREVHGTSLAAIVPIAISGAAAYAVEGSIDVVAALLLALGGAFGVALGTWLLRKLPQRIVRLFFAVLLIATAIRMFFDDPAQGAAVEITVALAAAVVAGGFVGGVLAGLLGIGGGIVLVPLLVIAFGMPLEIAKGTSLLAIVPTALVGTWRNVTHKMADLKLALVVGVVGMFSAVGGAWTAVRLDSEIAALLFAILLVVIAVRMMTSSPHKED